MNHTDDFLNPMLNDEGLQHMDMLSEGKSPSVAHSSLFSTKYFKAT